MSKAYVYDPRKTRLRRVRYTPKNDGLDWQRELYSVFCCTLVPPDAYQPEWKTIHEKKIGLPGVGAL
ncbi:hypothetical protein [Leptospira weilii]|uniref:hypothetical protein n=1 Tax=Leptospira weilii TaxID=28184 RepID=UPI000A4D462C|nr:hypothetical protein [Leptospira weilii]